ncbi:sec-independent translocase [Nocardioides sp.]|uniref:sec-independent translocase n=1 Tax=Nocardioides sp. TaxID=35761 RepID=UPI00378393BC
MFGIGLPELAVLAMIGALVLGPDKLPDLARQAARLVRGVKRFADGARDELRTQLGPDYADLELRDLDPRVVVRRHVASALEDDERDQLDDPPTTRRAPARSTTNEN